MPIEFFTSIELDLVYARWFGEVTRVQRLENFRNYTRDALFKAGRPELIDLSEITSTDFDYEAARLLVHNLKLHDPTANTPTPRALWAPDDVSYGCARMFQSVAEIMHDGRVEVFRNQSMALSALSLPFTDIASMRAAHDFVPQTYPNIAAEPANRATS